MKRPEDDRCPPEAFLETVRQHYACAFEEIGIGHLSGLLDVNTESEYFRVVRNMALGQKESLSYITAPQPIKDFPETTTSFIPSEFLTGIYDENGLTPIGKAISTLYRRAEALDINLNILMMAGSVQEILREKPKDKRRKKVDTDLVIVVDNPKAAITLFNDLLNLSLPEDCQYKIAIKKPCWRRGVTLIDVRDEEDKSIAQISQPECFYGHGPEVRFVMHAASRRNCSYILLVPDGKDLLGAAINLDQDRGAYERVDFFQRGTKVDYLYRTLTPTVYHCFELAYCMANPPEDLYHLLHELPTWSWGNLLPFANYYLRGKVNWKALFSQIDEQKRATIDYLAKEFAEKIAQKVVFPLAKNPGLIGDLDNPEMVRKVHEEMTKSMARTINGDPIIGLIRWLGKGEDPSLIPTPLPVYGLGLIDKEGFYQKLDRFLREGNRLKSLMAEMEVCEHGTKAGWTTFIIFLYRQSDYNLDTLIELLTPNFGSERLDQKTVNTFILPYLEIAPTVWEEIVSIAEEKVPLPA